MLTASGVSGLTIKNLAREMDFSESAVYRHFASKEDIIVSMLDYLAANMDERYAALDDYESAFKEKFLAMFRNQFRFFQDNPHFVVAVFSDGLMEASDRVNAAILHIMQVKLRHLMPLIILGRERGEISGDLEADQQAHIIMGAFRLLMYKWRLARFRFDLESEGEKMLHSLLLLLQNQRYEHH